MGGNKMNYQQTSLWKNSIDNEEYGNTELRNKLKEKSKFVG